MKYSRYYEKFRALELSWVGGYYTPSKDKKQMHSQRTHGHRAPSIKVIHPSMRLSCHLTHHLGSCLLSAQRTEPRICGQLATSSIYGDKRGTYLSKVSASWYAFRANHTIRARSPMKKNQLRNRDQENKRWKTIIAVNKRADCQAWNLSRGALAKGQIHRQPKASETHRKLAEKFIGRRFFQLPNSKRSSGSLYTSAEDTTYLT